MALYTKEELENQNVWFEKPRIESVPDSQSESVTWGEAFSAGMSTVNPIKATYDYMQDRNEYQSEYGEWERDEDYNPFEDVEHLGKYWEFSDEFLNSGSPLETEFIKRRIDKELEHWETISNAGLLKMIVGVGGAAMLDPIAWAPVGGIAYKGAQVAKNISTARTAGKMAAVGMGSMTASELILHQSQHTLTPTDSAIAVGGAGILSGLLGAGVAKLSKTQQLRAIAELDQSMGLQQVQQGGQSSQMMGGGAANVRELTAEQRSQHSNLGTKATGTDHIHWTIGSQLDASESAAVHKHRDLIASRSTYSRAEMDGEAAAAQSIETRRDLHYVRLAETLKGLRSDFYAYVTGKSDAGFANKMVSRLTAKTTGHKLSYTKFKTRVSEQVRRGTFDDEIPEVNAAAKKARAFWDKYETDLINNGLMEKGELNYFTRVYKQDEIAKRRGEFVRILEDYFTRVNPDLEDITGIANDITDRILKIRSGRMALPKDLYSKAGHLKGRTLNVPEELISDFLEHDIEKVLGRYVHTVAPDLEIAKVYGKGNPIDTIKHDIDTDYQKLWEAAAGDPKRQAKLMDRKQKDLDLMVELIDRVKGMNMHPDNAAQAMLMDTAKFIRGLATVTMLGKVVITSLPDIMKPMMEHGFQRGAKVILANISSFGEAYKLSKADLTRSGALLDLVTHQRALAFAEMYGVRQTSGKMSAGMDMLVENFGKWSGMDYWNATMKSYTGMAAADEFIESALKIAAGQRVSKGNMRRLLNAGIDEDMAKRIAQQYQQHGMRYKGLHISQMGSWDDAVARDAFETALNKIQNIVIVTPGAEDMPKLFGVAGNNEILKTMMQFKSFLFSSQAKTLKRGLQGSNASFYYSGLAMMFTGMLSERIHMLINGEENIPTDWKYWFYHGMDRAGIFPILEVSNIAHQLQIPSLHRAIGIDEGHRFRERGLGAAIAGPGGGIVSDRFFPIAKDFLNLDVDERTIRNMKRIIPYNNALPTELPKLLGMKSVFDMGEEALADLVD